MVGAWSRVTMLNQNRTCRPRVVTRVVTRAPPPVCSRHHRHESSTPPGQPVGTGKTFVLDDTGGDPGNTTAVTLNLTITQPNGPGYVTAYPCDQERPDVSNVNFTAGQDVANQATVKIAHDGTICLYAFTSTHILADIAGYMDSSRIWSPEFRTD
jgi:hypothetical protein